VEESDIKDVFLRKTSFRYPNQFFFETTSNMADLETLTAQSLFDIKNWVCVVTGGGSGLGLITARSLAANGAKGMYTTHPLSVRG
jgi:hypothetical protein